VHWSDILGMSLGGLVGVAAVVLAVVLIWGSVSTDLRFRGEEKQWEQLRAHGRRTEAEIVALARPPGRLIKRGRHAADMAATELRLAFSDAEGRRREASVQTFIDTELIANFTAGHKVHVVHSDEDPPQVAIDRDRTQLEIPSTTSP
jgi:hypothetical protein